jgi:hypothetical protein
MYQSLYLFGHPGFHTRQALGLALAQVSNGPPTRILPSCSIPIWPKLKAQVSNLAHELLHCGCWQWGRLQALLQQLLPLCLQLLHSHDRAVAKRQQPAGCQGERAQCL